MKKLLIFFLLISFQAVAQVDLWSTRLLNSAQEEKLVEVFVPENEATALVAYPQLEFKYQFNSTMVYRAPVRIVRELITDRRLKNIRLDFNSGRLLSNNSRRLSSYDTLAMKRLHQGKRYTGMGVLIGILDSGIDFDHPDFKDKQGNTRLKAIWDQTQSGSPQRTPVFGYGQVWDSTDIDQGVCTHRDPNTWFGHGSNVSGIAAGNGNSVPDSISDYSGYAPEASLAVVAIDFSSLNFRERVADGVEFLFDLADSLNMPCVINASLGTYIGSHDAKDFQARRIVSLIQAKEGRAMVCAGGNSGEWPAYHLRYDLNTDTAFSWFKLDRNNQVFFEMWADTADIAGLNFKLGFDHHQNYQSRASTANRPVMAQLGQVVTDTLRNVGNRLGVVQVWRALDGDRLRMQVYAPIIDSVDYHFHFELTGTGKADIWSSSNFGWSDIVQGPLPDPGLFPAFRNYVVPDINQSIVSSWACSPEVITVGNLINNSSYIDYSGTVQSYPLPEESIAASSSRGPNRLDQLKPDLVAPGERSFSAGRLVDLNIQRNVASLHYALAPGGFHNRNGGSSMASPAVAGTIALLLERCSKLDQDTIKKMLLNSLRKRTEAPILRGYGQLDVKSLLLESENKVHIMSSDPDMSFCDGDSLLLSLTSNLNKIQWNTGNTNRLQVSSTTDTYFADAENVYGCPVYSDTIYTTRFHPKEFELGSDTSICVGTSIGIDEDFSTYRWSTGEQTAWVVPFFPGAFNLITTDSNDCIWRDSIRVRELYPLPSPDLGADTIICQGTSIQLFPGRFKKYEWSDGSQLAVRVHRGFGSYEVTVTDSNSCQASDQIQISTKYCPKITGLDANPDHEVRLFPNPSSGISFLQCHTVPQFVDIIDASGRTVEHFRGSSHMKLELKNIDKGLYFVHLRYSDDTEIRLKWFVY